MVNGLVFGNDLVFQKGMVWYGYIMVKSGWRIVNG